MSVPLKKFFAKFSVFLMIWTVLLGSSAANAAEISVMRDEMTRNMISTGSDHQITFKLPTALTASQTISLAFATTTLSGFSFVAGMTPTRDMGVSTKAAGTAGPFECSDSDNGGTGSYGTEITGAANTATSTAAGTATLWGVSTTSNAVDSVVVKFTSPSTVMTYIAAGVCVRVHLGTQVTGGAGVVALTNPGSVSSSSNQYVTTISTPSDSGQFAVGISLNDQPAVTATNTPTMTFELGTVTCDTTTAASAITGTALRFYDLRADYVEPSQSQLCTRVSTNAGHGASLLIKSAWGQMTSTRAGINFPAAAQAAASSTINISSGINTSTEAYGICIVASGSGAASPASGSMNITNGYAGTCGTTQNLALTGGQNFRLLSTSWDTVWSSTDAVYLAYASMILKAAVTVNTPPDNAYTDTLTVIAVATY